LLPDLEALYISAAVILGVLFGSFLNVCIYRVPRDLSVVAPRSFCPGCAASIRWFDNVPLLSYAFLKGRCRYCGERIALRYPIVELTMAIMFGLIALEYRWDARALKWAFFEGLVVALLWTDLEDRILPDELTLGGLLAGLVFAVFIRTPGQLNEIVLPGSRMLWQSLFNAGLGAIVLAGPIWLLGAIYARVRKREGLGLGDVKLLALIGVFLGPENGLLALLIGTLSGSVVGLAYIWLARKNASTYELPFGSFLCVGAALVPLIKRL